MRQKAYNPKLKRFKELLGSNMRLLRKVSGLTGEQFAKEIGISRNHLFNIENAKAYGLVYDALHYISQKADMNKFLKNDLSINLIRIPTHQDIQEMKNGN